MENDLYPYNSILDAGRYGMQILFLIIQKPWAEQELFALRFVSQTKELLAQIDLLPRNKHEPEWANLVRSCLGYIKAIEASIKKKNLDCYAIGHLESITKSFALQLL